VPAPNAWRGGHSMSVQPPVSGRQLLWRYGIAAAFVSTVLLWALFGGALAAAHFYLSWPDSGSLRFLVPAVLIVSLVPVIFVVVDYVAGQRGVIDIKGFKIDFSQAAAQLRSFEIPANIGSSGASLADSGAVAIKDALDSAIRNDIVCLDLESGNAWWVSRLLVLCVGAVGVGSPHAIVFVGTKDRTLQRFLGWAEPSSIIAALHETRIFTDNRDLYQPVNLGHRKLEPKAPTTITYGEVIDKAVVIARQVPALNYFYTHQNVLPTIGNISAEYDGVIRYVADVNYVAHPQTASAFIVMDQIGLMQLEAAPDRLTLVRLEELLSPCLYRDAIELQDPPENQLANYANAKGAYIALVRNGAYEQLVEVASLGRTFIKQIVAPAAASPPATSR
jgi:hypothetical protein